MNILTCPRCGEHKLEIMKSYSFCWECGYAPSEDHAITNHDSVEPSLQMIPVDQALEEILERAA